MLQQPRRARAMEPQGVLWVKVKPDTPQTVMGGRNAADNVLETGLEIPLRQTLGHRSLEVSFPSWDFTIKQGCFDLAAPLCRQAGSLKADREAAVF